MMLEMLKPEVVEKLKQYDIGDGDYKFKMGKYHGEGREGIPYRMLIIRKGIPKEEQTELEMELKKADETLCVIFKKFTR
ncbi:hypothetical protein Mtc_2339 [Methanocella conradii HZ254]|uniref:Uncharacterized protein n=1 Tax=Methanocella conradii (strain DSM 24694 / JCM 17849 / CGMCC 1.5162 / HZ254) TaxID=1041930 RepID=H8I4X8_METCZ|nr:hypothetical protein [Methanocella conradii]AFD01072.1 hypothetical protein Mtc_2339 [Methanocella conradii HZ254]MDI6897839.1 hypothetical protein [Methanocella conradii]